MRREGGVIDEVGGKRKEGRGKREEGRGKRKYVDMRGRETCSTINYSTLN